MSLLDRPMASREDRLKRIAEEIGTLTVSTEDDFLALGESLQDVYRRSADMTETGKSLAGLLSGESMGRTVEDLRELAGRMTGYMKASEEVLQGDLAALESVRSCLERSRRVFGRFGLVARTLNILGTLTRIESAHLRGGGQSFRFLSDEVARQSAQIGQSASDVLDSLDSLDRQVQSLLSKLRDFHEKQSGQGRAVLDLVASSLSDLLAKQSASSEAIRCVSERSEQISRSVGEVVMSMQFHDITRQRLEHVKDALTDLVEDENNQGFRGACELQTALLRQAGDDFNAAVRNIFKNLDRVAESLDQGCRETREFVNQKEGAGESFLDRLERDMLEAAAALRRHDSAGREIETAVASVAETIEVMNEFLAGVQGSGYSIKFIALNATIRAAKIGRQGMTLDILAEAIRDVAGEARQYTDTLAAVHRDIEEARSQLRKERSRTAEVEAAVGELTEVLDAVRQANSRSLVMMNEVEGKSRALTEDIRDLLGGVTVHRRVETRIGEALVGLGEILEQTPADPSSGEPGSGEGLEALASRYTMESERAVHQAVLTSQDRKAAGGGPADPTPQGDDILDDGFELFDAPAPETSAGEADLGDGIELFGDPAATTEEETDLGDGVELFSEPAPKPEEEAEESGDEDLGDNVELF
ncbi:MAG: hypothetical protein KKB20_04925 [Proteobacteria bacterium]|nr:hypothetical protein [Pseudomonadota bacterium]